MFHFLVTSFPMCVVNLTCEGNIYLCFIIADRKFVHVQIKVEDVKVCLTRDADEKNVDEGVSMMSGIRGRVNVEEMSSPEKYSQIIKGGWL